MRPNWTPGSTRKLTLAEQQRALALRRQGKSQRAVAKQFGVHPSTILRLERATRPDPTPGSAKPSRTDEDSSNTPKHMSWILHSLEELWSRLPEDAFDDLPSDLSVNLDHYLYGAPKRE